MDLENIKSDKVMDTRGLTRPMPLIKTRKALRSMKIGKVLEIWCSDAEAKAEIPAMHGENGCAYLGCLADQDGYTRFFIRKGAAELNASLIGD